jgi:DNA-binding IclR family transcriptional regulator
VIELPGVRSIAVPLRDKNNVPIAGISVSTLTTRMDKARSDLALSEITKAIEQIQQHLHNSETE